MCGPPAAPWASPLHLLPLEAAAARHGRNQLSCKPYLAQERCGSGTLTAMSTSTPRPRCVADLVELERQGHRLKLLFFWGHQPPRTGGVGTGCLSQWWPARFTLDGTSYPTAEHYMMVHKARLFGDHDTAARILAAAHPGAAKALGRQVRGFDEDRWATHRYDLVVQASTAKFAQNPKLREYLLGTGDRVLVEASPVDRIWGIGLTAQDERAQHPSAWRGLNLLGFALMDARDVVTTA
jgi:ribA/ribD-fused uncharacterized protein